MTAPAPRSPSRTRSERLVLAVCVALSLLAGLCFLNPYLDSDGDNAGYLTLARALATGRGFTSINFPGTIPHTQYHPLYPLVLAPIVAAFPGNWLAPKLPSLVFTMIFVVAVWNLFKRRTGGSLWTLGLLTAAVALNRYVAEYAAATMTEALFLALSYGALALAEAPAGARARRDGFLIGALLAGAYMTKPVGIALVAAVCVALFMKSPRTRAVTATLVAALVIFAWSVRNDRVVTPANAFEHALYGNVTYSTHVLARDSYNPELGLMTPGEFLVKWGTLIVKNLDPLANNIHPAFTVGLVAIGKAEERALWFAIPFVLVALLGWARSVREQRGPAELYILFYLGLASLYPAVRARYLFPVLPLALYYFARGADAAVGWIRRVPAPAQGPAGPAGIVVLASAVILSALLVARQARFTLQDNFGPRGADNLYDRVDLGASAYHRAVAWIDAHAPKDAVIMDSKPWNSYLLSGHPTSTFAFSRDTSKTVALIHRHGVDYVIEDGWWHWETRKFLKPVLAAYPRAFRLVHVERGPDTFVYRVDRGALPPR
jgi:hypothetical protein